MAYDIGQNAVLGIALQDETSGTSFGQSPLTYDYIRIKPGGFKYKPENAKNIIEELDVDPNFVCVGGLYYTWSAEMVMSYSYREKWFMLLLGGTDTYAAGPPMTHEITAADKVRYGSINFIYTDEAAQDSLWASKVFANVVVTSLGLKLSPEGEMTLSVSGIASSMTPVRNFAGQSVTVRTTEPICWNPGTFTPTIGGTTTYRLSDFALDCGAPMQEGEFDMAASTPAAMSAILRSGMRDVKWTVGMRADSAVDTLVTAVGTALSSNSFSWDNGTVGAGQRQFLLTLGTSYIDGASRTLGEWGRESVSMACVAKDSASPRIMTVKFTNALSGEIVVT